MLGLPNPYAIGGIALALASLTGWAIWERHDAAASAKGELAAVERATLAEQDARRWHAASDQRDAAIGGLTAAIAGQNAAVERLQFSLDRANEAAAHAEADSRDARAQFDQRIQELNDAARSHPEDVVPVGRLVRERVDRLWD
jgi:hypothetical protein